MEYRGIVKTREKWLIGLFLILAAIMLWRTIATQHWVYVPMVILVILACFFTKEHVVSEEGVDVRYILFGRFTMHNLWRWEEITSMQTDYRKAAPNVALLIAKDVVIRPFIMTRPDMRGSLAMARRMNPSIQMNEVPEDEQESRDQQTLHRQEVQRAQQQTAKKKRRSRK